MGGNELLHFHHFVDRSAGRPHPFPVSLLLAYALIALAGCARHPNHSVEDTETSGRIKVVSVPEARPLLEAEIAAFRKAYPEAAIEVASGTSREAVAALL